MIVGRVSDEQGDSVFNALIEIEQTMVRTQLSDGRAGIDQDKNIVGSALTDREGNFRLKLKVKNPKCLG